MQEDNKYILAEFKGTYRAPHPDGQRDLQVTRPFHVKVKMKAEVIHDSRVLGLNGLFATYYKEFLRRQFPDMVDLYFFDLVEATELDGTPIEHPKALSHSGLLQYLEKKKYPINCTLYTPAELRNEIMLYEVDKEGQQKLEGIRTELRGSELAVAAELQNLSDVMVVVDDTHQSVEDLLSVAGKSKRK